MVRLDYLKKEKMQYHSLPVGHGRRHGETRPPGKRKMQCHSHPVGHGRHVETRLPSERENAISLTYYWS